MYKTVRHGENSLQYTILPQTEEVLTNSGLRGKGRDYSPSVHVRRARRRRSTARCVALVAVGALVALALAVVPLYAFHGALGTRRPSDAPLTPASFLPTSRDMGKSRKKELKIGPDLAFSSVEVTSTSDALSVGNRATTPPWVLPTLKSWRATEAVTTSAPGSTVGNRGSVPLFDSTSELANLGRLPILEPRDRDVIITPTVTPEQVTSRHPARVYSRANAPATATVMATAPTKTFSDALITIKPTTTVRAQVTTAGAEVGEVFKLKDLKEALLSADDDDEFKESLEVDEVFSLPPLGPATDTGMVGVAQAGDDVTVSRAGGPWYGAQWPFVDTSSYFQWTGYSPGDNLLLPLLVAALSSLALVLLLALALRRRHRTHCANAQVGKLTADLQEDNTNLLAAENVEDE